MREKQVELVQEQFINRWSPRAFDGSSIDTEQLNALFEAARWAPSCFNAQPWLFVCNKSASTQEKFVEGLVEGNKVWAKNAPHITYIFAAKNFKHNGKPNKWSAFDAGAAWMSLALQAQALGLVVHGMGGFSAEKAFEICGISSDDYDVLCAVAIGKQGTKDNLPSDLAEKEAPSDRKPLKDTVTFL